MTGIWTAICAILIFCILIFIHELGHFIAAKLLNICVHEFAIGMGPKLFSKQKGETLYSVRALPIGGFCALEGEDTSSDDARALSNRPAWAKLIVLVSGAFMNLLLGFVLLLLLFGTAKGVVVSEVEQVETNSIAAQAGICAGDEIYAVDGRRVHIPTDISWQLSRIGGKDFTITVLRDGEKMDLVATQKQTGESKLGIGLKAEKNNVFLTVRYAYHTTVFYARMVIETFIDLLRGRIGIEMMSGPIGIVSEIGSAVQQTAEQGWAGFTYLVQLTILLTVNLGVFNLFPIPALDGGRIFFVFIEMIRRKPLPPEKEGIVHFVGFALLILLSLVIAYLDVMKLF